MAYFSRSVVHELRDAGWVSLELYGARAPAHERTTGCDARGVGWLAGWLAAKEVKEAKAGRAGRG